MWKFNRRLKLESEKEIRKQITGMKKLLDSGKCDSPMRTQRHLRRLEESIGI